MHRDTWTTTRNCKRCRNYSSRVIAPKCDEESIEVPQPPWEIEIIGSPPAPRGEGDILITVINYFANWGGLTFSVPPADRDAERFVWKHIMNKCGILRILSSESGGPFVKNGKGQIKERPEGVCTKMKSFVTKAEKPSSEDAYKATTMSNALPNRKVEKAEKFEIKICNRKKGQTQTLSIKEIHRKRKSGRNIRPFEVTHKSGVVKKPVIVKGRSKPNSNGTSQQA